MSTYETYEFFALDRRLTAREMGALRAISSRAVITPTRFWNHYEWGGLKGDPREMLREWFDLFVYQEMNSGARWGMLRFPADRVDLRRWRPYVTVRRGSPAPASCASVTTYERVTVLDVTAPEHVGGVARSGAADEADDDEYDREDDEVAYGDETVDKTSWPVPLALVRADLLAGDLRPLYLLWLAGVQSGDRGSAAREPPIPEGCDRMTGTLYAFAEFLRLDPDLLVAAIEDVPAHPAVVPRTAGALLRAARACGVERRRAAAMAAAAERARRLTALAGRQNEEWGTVERLVGAKQSRAYDDAVTRLRALRELNIEQGTTTAFTARLQALLDAHRSKHGFRERVRRAKLLSSFT